MTNKFSIFNFQRLISRKLCLFSIKSQSGQVIVILLLLMLVALSIGLAVTQRSVTDVTTSTQTEQSSRAFSAAEAGLEKALSGSITEGSFSLDNSASSNIQASVWLPEPSSGAAIEYPPIGRETTAQIWFTDPATPAITYTENQFYIYFGNESTADKPAVEVEIVMETNNNFYTKTYYLDSDPARVSSNNFSPVPGCGSKNLDKSILGNDHKFFCSYLVGPIPNVSPLGGNCYSQSPACKLILARIRLLYSSENHKIALAPFGTGQLPQQVQIYNSTGIAGQSQKQIQAFRVKDVVPPWFNFAVFSINEIRK